MSTPTYTQRDIAELEFPGAEEEGFDDVKFVLHADHVAAVAEAVRAAKQAVVDLIGNLDGEAVKAERARIYQAVEALIDDGREYQAVMLRGVLSIIDGDSDV